MTCKCDNLRRSTTDDECKWQARSSIQAAEVQTLLGPPPPRRGDEQQSICRVDSTPRKSRKVGAEGGQGTHAMDLLLGNTEEGGGMGQEEVGEGGRVHTPTKAARGRGEEWVGQGSGCSPAAVASWTEHQREGKPASD